MYSARSNNADMDRVPRYSEDWNDTLDSQSEDWNDILDSLQKFQWDDLGLKLWKRIASYFGKENVKLWNAFSTCCFHCFYEIGCELQPGRRNWPSQGMVLLKEYASWQKPASEARRRWSTATVTQASVQEHLTRARIHGAHTTWSDTTDSDEGSPSAKRTRKTWLPLECPCDSQHEQ